jgi:hypothetical protein
MQRLLIDCTVLTHCTHCTPQVIMNAEATNRLYCTHYTLYSLHIVFTTLGHHECRGHPVLDCAAQVSPSAGTVQYSTVHHMLCLYSYTKCRYSTVHHILCLYSYTKCRYVVPILLVQYSHTILILCLYSYRMDLSTNSSSQQRTKQSLPQPPLLLLLLVALKLLLAGPLGLTPPAHFL